MNYKQKLGYMFLGAVILALGIIVGQVITPDIEAQNNGVFDSITCRSLTVLDKFGRDAIMLNTTNNNNSLTVWGKTGGAIGLVAHETEGYAVVIYGKDPQKQPSVRLYHHVDKGSGIFIQNKHGKNAIVLRSNDNGNDILLYDLYENLRAALISSKKVDGIAVWDKAGNVKWGSPQ